MAIVAGQTKRLVYRVIAESGLTITPDQWTVLYYLWKEDGLTMGELAACMKKDFANVTRVVELLVRDGYIKKVRNSEDKRSYRVFIQPKVNGIQAAIENVFQIMETLSLKGISKDEQKVMLGILARIESNVIEQLEKKGVY
jgi:DNA-binding MarR family transcriptional regulator